MVFFVISRQGFESFLTIAEKFPTPLWIAFGILSQDELDEFRSLDFDITDFNYSINSNELDVLECAIETIREHHPNEVIWMHR